MPFTTLNATARQALVRRAEEAHAVGSPEVMSLEFRTGVLKREVEPTQLVAEVKSWHRADCGFIYYFESSMDERQAAAALAAFTAAKNARHGQRAYARALRPSKTLYVGSSESIASRFREHLGYHMAVKTYSMQLAYWAQPLDISLRMVCARYPSSVTSSLLGVLEDALWDELKPMLGRQGRS